MRGARARVRLTKPASTLTQVTTYPYTDYFCSSTPSSSFYVALGGCTVVGGDGFSASYTGSALLLSRCPGAVCSCPYPTSNQLAGPSVCSNVVTITTFAVSAEWAWASDPNTGGGSASGAEDRWGGAVASAAVAAVAVLAGGGLLAARG